MKSKFILVLGITISITQLRAQSEKIRIEHFNTSKQIALQGYDAVSYFEGKPVSGKTELKWNYNGIVYQFATRTNLEKFKSSPEKYEPAYGGWCAFAMGEKGEKVKIDPETYKILDGRLYLFYNFWGNNTLSDWNKNEKKLKAAGDRNWMKIIP